MTASGKLTVENSAGKRVVIDGSDLDFEISSTDERSMGTESCHQAEYSDDENDFNVTVEVYEYPSGTYNTHEVSVSDGWRVIGDNLDFDFSN